MVPRTCTFCNFCLIQVVAEFEPSNIGFIVFDNDLRSIVKIHYHAPFSSFHKVASIKSACTSFHFN